MWTPKNNTENGVIFRKGGWPSWRHTIFFLKITEVSKGNYFLESPKILPCGPSACSLSNLRQRRKASRICIEYREFIMRTESKDTREAYVLQRKDGSGI